MTGQHHGKPPTMTETPPEKLELSKMGIARGENYLGGGLSRRQRGTVTLLGKGEQGYVAHLLDKHNSEQ